MKTNTQSSLLLKRTNARAAAAAGFTLVELLVVIGIIALLISILLPVLGSARRAALSVKCLSNLRQCGQALHLYVDNNKGYVFPVRAGGSPPSNNVPGTDTNQAVPYDLYGFTYGWTSNDATHNTSAAWWMNFLAKYVTAYRGGAGDVNTQTTALVRNTVFWCPAWTGARNANDDGAWVHVTGYSFNYMVSLTGSHPQINTSADQAAIPSKEWLNIQLKPGGGTIANSGTWYKLNQITQPAQRCFLADAAALQLEAWRWEAGQIPQSMYGQPPPQGLLPAMANQSMYTGGAASPTVKCQTTFDCYRHGVYPKTINYTGYWGSGTCFDPAGGKVSYNILYYDGHAISTPDRTEAYRSVRMRWPG